MDRIQINVPLAPSHLPLRFETLWAERLDAHRRALLNSSFFMPLAVGDIVYTESRKGREVVTAYIQPGDKVLSVILVDTIVSDSEQTAVTESWRSLGAQWTEGSRGLLLTVWHGPTADEVFEHLKGDIGARDGWHTPLVYGPDVRALEAAKFFD